MNGAFYIGATGLRAQERGLEVIANNLSNVNTVAFKRSEIRFEELVSQTKQSETRDPVPVSLPDVLSGVQARLATRVFEQGALRQTDKPFDIAVSGDGLIELLGPNGQTYLWRGGTLRVNADGFLETENGLMLKAQIEVPDNASSITISRDGKVQSIAAGAETPAELGQILLAKPRDITEMEAIGGGYYRVQNEADIETLTPGDTGVGVLVQGSLEGSNVDLSTELVTLLLLQRSYGANAQVVQAGDQLMAIANGLRR
jgi:flagellar basal-body rod protein FlgG